MSKCECGACSNVSLDDYDEIIEQLKETRRHIDKMIATLEARKVKDDVINQILNTEYEEEDDEEEHVDIDGLLESLIKDNIKVNKYVIPEEPKIFYYPYKKMFYPYF